MINTVVYEHDAATINHDSNSNSNSNIYTWLNPLSANPANWSHTHSSNLSAVANELFECVWPFCRDGA